MSSEAEEQPWHEQISDALDVERFEVDLFRSKTLWLPNRGRGVFGGQVISQALVSATQTVDPVYGLHVALHCYFLLSASASVPIVYFVERLRNGRSYITRAVKAVQNGKMVFFMMCSFHKPEPWQPVGQWSMPPNVPPPEDCPTEEERYQVLLKKEGLDADMRKIYVDIIAERKRSPIAVKPALEKDRVSGGSGMTRYMFWLQARDIPKYEPHFQKCILSYMSDLYVLGVAARTLGLERVGKGPNVRSMTSTIDHAVAFYDDTFDCGDWLLYVMASPRAASGRAIVYGQIYKRDGTLVAITTQEGVVRANRRGPEPAKL